MDKYFRTHKLAWLRLNSDLLFIIGLAVGSAVFNLLDPNRDSIVEATGDIVTPLFLLVNCGMLLSAALLFLSLAVGRIKIEVLGRAVMLGALGVSVYRDVILLGFFDNETQQSLVLLTIWLLSSALRISVLFTKGGLVFRFPPEIPHHQGRP